MAARQPAQLSDKNKNVQSVNRDHRNAMTVTRRH